MDYCWKRYKVIIYYISTVGFVSLFENTECMLDRGLF